MSFTGRIRLSLVALALLPPLLMMAVVYFYSTRQAEVSYRRNASEDLGQLLDYREQYRDRLAHSLGSLTEHSWFERSVRLAERGRGREISFDDLRGFDLDFYELVDPTGRVVASSHRPGLVGEPVPGASGDSNDGPALFESVEYDIDGRHAALAGLAPGRDGFGIYGGRYLGRSFLPSAQQIIHGRLAIEFTETDGRMTTGSLYRRGDFLEAIILGDTGAGFVVTAAFEPADRSAVFASFINAISLVALVSVLMAVATGMYVSARTKKEFDNLIDAFDRVAAGDLDTAVMAYTEGEFSRLADSFSEMTRKLRRSQRELATTEKIAAWQTMARKIAHEIKNPLTPIGIGADDLRRSYLEKLPGFDETLDRNTRMIRTEINRLTRLLDEFVSFARMKPPEINAVTPEMVLANLETLYRDEVSTGRLTTVNRSSRKTIKADPDLLSQILVNLVKNGLEAENDVGVTVTVDDVADGIRITVADTGPGFSDDQLSRRFEPYLSSKKDGSGLGLVICERIVNDHGGSIDLANRTEGGAEVVIILPQD